MGATSPFFIFIPNETEISLVHERGGLQGLSRRFVRHLVRRQSAQLLIDERQQFVGGRRIALFDSEQDAGDVAHFISPLVFTPLSISVLASRMNI